MQLLIDQPEFAHPYEILAPHCEITVASHLGGEAAVDEGSIKAFSEDESSMTFLKHHNSLWKNTIKLETLVGKVDRFDVILYVGGYGRKSNLNTARTAAPNGLLTVRSSYVRSRHLRCLGSHRWKFLCQ